MLSANSRCPTNTSVSLTGAGTVEILSAVSVRKIAWRRLLFARTFLR